MKIEKEERARRKGGKTKPKTAKQEKTKPKRDNKKTKKTKKTERKKKKRENKKRRTERKPSIITRFMIDSLGKLRWLRGDPIFCGWTATWGETKKGRISIDLVFKADANSPDDIPSNFCV